MSSDRDESERAPPRAAVIRRAIDALLQRLPKAMPAAVTQWEPETGRVHCKVLVQRPYVDEEDVRQIESLPVIPGVPLIFPGGGGFRLTCPISDGNLIIDGQTVPATTGLLVWCDRSIDRWLSGSGNEVDPELDHVHGYADAVFIPGLNPFGAPLNAIPTDKLSIGRDQSPSDIEIDGQGNINIANGSNGAARESDPVGHGTIAFTFAGGSGAATLSIVYTPGDGSAPQNLATGTGTLTIKEKIQGGSSKVSVG